MNVLSKKEIEIITFLSKQNEFVSAQKISNELGFSVRSVKNYIKNINTTFENSILSSRYGYRIKNISLFDQYLHYALDDIPPQNKNERMIILFKELLINNEKFYIEELAERLCVSSDTMLREIRQFKQEIDSYQLNIVINDDSIYIDGNENNKRSAISSFILTDIKESIFSFNALEKYYPDYQIETIHKIIFSILHQNSYFLDDFSIFNLLLHIVIVMDRTQSHLHLQKDKSSPLDNMVPFHVHNIASAICLEIEKESDIQFYKNDIYDLSLLLSTRLTKFDENISSIDMLKINTDKEIMDLLQSIEDKLKLTYNLNFSNDNLRVRFYVHIKNLILRITHHLNISNPMIKEMRNHIYIYDVAISITKIISEKYNTYISEDEVAYIAMHLIFSFNEETIQKSQIPILLICPNYGNARELALDKIKTIFRNDLFVKDVVGQFPKNIKNGYDFIISTITSNRMLPYKYIKINSPLSNKDILNISNSIEQINKKKKIQRFKSELQHFFKRDFFYYEPNQHQQMNEILDFVSDQLFEKSYVPNTFKTMLHEREELYSSAYDNVAIPHPLSTIAYKSAISIYICPHGITWNNQSNVNIVFTLALTQEDQILFKRLFELISELLIIPQSLNILLKASTYDEFINTLIELCHY